MMGNEFLEEIINYYLLSGDFNGLPIYNRYDYNLEVLIQLIKEGLVEVISENDVRNPHIKALDLNLSIEHQIETVKNGKVPMCIYPTPKALEDIVPDYTKPYTMVLQKGAYQFDIVFFSIEILERYNNNPKFSIMDYGYGGTIFVKNEFSDEGEDEDYIKDYGMAYFKGEQLNRAVGVFLRDLANLSSNTQMLWKGLEIKTQESCFVHPNFKRTLLMGEWVNDYWILDAILDEMKVINEQCSAMGLPPLFNKLWGIDYQNRPDGYRTIMLPTMKNYNDFVLVLEKMFVSNISIDTFQVDALRIKKVERKDQKGDAKGSIVMLKEWLLQNVEASFDINEKIINPLRKIRKIRQTPAHEMCNNEYDIAVYKMQNELIRELYGAMYAMRRLFQGHPLAKCVEIPKHLDEDNIVFY